MLRSMEAVDRLIGTATTVAELKVRAALDRRKYPVGRMVSDAETATIR